RADDALALGAVDDLPIADDPLRPALVFVALKLAEAKHATGDRLGQAARQQRIDVPDLGVNLIEVAIAPEAEAQRAEVFLVARLAHLVFSHQDKRRHPAASKRSNWMLAGHRPCARLRRTSQH